MQSNSIENLKPFTAENQPPKRGNKKGNLHLTTILRKYMDQEMDVNDPFTKEQVKRRIGDIICLKLIASAMKGNLKAIQTIFDRLEGKPLQPVDFGGGIDITENINFDINILSGLPEDELVRLGKVLIGRFNN